MGAASAHRPHTCSEVSPFSCRTATLLVERKSECVGLSCQATGGGVAYPGKTTLVALVVLAVLSSCTSWSDELAAWRLVDEPDGATLQVQAVFGGAHALA